MFNKKVFLLLCSFGISIVPTVVLAMEDFPLSGPFNLLASVMQPIFQAQACTPEMGADLMAAVGEVRRVIGDNVGIPFEPLRGYPMAEYSIDGAIEEQNYRRTMCFYKYILERDIAFAWGLLTPEDREILRVEVIKTNAEIDRLAKELHPELEIRRFSPVRVGFAAAVLGVLGYLTYKLING